jgi:hypothetical protein
MSNANSPLSTDGPYALDLYHRFRLVQAFPNEHYRLLLAYEELEEHL